MVWLASYLASKHLPSPMPLAFVLLSVDPPSIAFRHLSVLWGGLVAEPPQRLLFLEGCICPSVPHRPQSLAFTAVSFIQVPRMGSTSQGPHTTLDPLWVCSPQTVLWNPAINAEVSRVFWRKKKRTSWPPPQFKQIRSPLDLLSLGML